MARIRYQVTDSRGQVHKRTSVRIYTHAVVYHVPAQAPTKQWPRGLDGHSKAAFCGSDMLASNEAASLAKRYAVEVIPVEVV